MTSPPALMRVADGVATITLNRPDRRNAWSLTLEDRYFDLLSDADSDPAVRAIVVTGAGTAFCVGADLERAQDAISASETTFGCLTRRPITLPLAIRKPLIGAINGAAAGVGLAQALMFDVRFAVGDAKLTFAFSKLGLPAEHCCSWLLPRLVGTSAALDLLLSSRVVLADEAARLGLINVVVSAGASVLEAATAYALELARDCSPAAMAMIKEQVRVDSSASIAESRDRSSALAADAAGAPDVREGLAAFTERRGRTFAPLPPPPIDLSQTNRSPEAR